MYIKSKHVLNWTYRRADGLTKSIIKIKKNTTWKRVQEWWSGFPVMAWSEVILIRWGLSWSISAFQLLHQSATVHLCLSFSLNFHFINNKIREAHLWGESAQKEIGAISQLGAEKITYKYLIVWSIYIHINMPLRKEKALISVFKTKSFGKTC